MAEGTKASEDESAIVEGQFINGILKANIITKIIGNLEDILTVKTVRLLMVQYRPLMVFQW